MSKYPENLVAQLLKMMDEEDSLMGDIRRRGGLMSEADDERLNTIQTNIVELRDALNLRT